EADGNDAIQTVYTNEPQQYGNLISSRIAGTTSYHHFDALGSTRQLTNAAGSTTDSVIYDAWGNVVARTGTTSLALLWLGESAYYNDTESGLTYIRARQYGPTIARWVSRDSLLFISAPFPYIYVANRPLVAIDPSGAVFIKKNDFHNETCGRYTWTATFG